MSIVQSEKSKFPHVKGVCTKRTKFGHRYILTEPDPNGVPRSITIHVNQGDSVEVYLQKVGEARAELRRRHAERGFSDYLNEYFRQKMLAEGTERVYRIALRGFSLNDSENERAASALMRGNRRKSTLANYFSRIRAFFSWLIEKGVRVKNPAIDVRSDSVPRGRVMTDDEIARLSAYARTRPPLYRLFILLLLHTGARISTLYAIKKNDLTEDGLQLYNVKCKRYYAYIIPIQCKEIRDLWLFGSDVGGIFGSKKFHASLNSWMRYHFGKDSKGQTLSAHSIRHTFASRAVQNGVPLEIVSKLLDHQSMSVTAKYYAKFSPKQISDAVAKAVKDFST